MSARSRRPSSAVPSEGLPLGGPLDLDEALGPRHHDVHVHLGRRVLHVVQVDDRGTEDDSDAGRGDRSRKGSDRSRRSAELLEGIREGDVPARDRGRAGSAVGLDDVAIDGDRALAERVSCTTARNERPTSRWISCVRPPPARPASRPVRVDVARGSMPYSAVTQPWPLPRRNGGTRSSTDAVQITRVSPTSTRTAPSACGT